MLDMAGGRRRMDVYIIHEVYVIMSAITSVIFFLFYLSFFV